MKNQLPPSHAKISYLAKFPVLYNLLMTADYDENLIEQNDKRTLSILERRLHELASSSAEHDGIRDDSYVMGNGGNHQYTRQPSKTNYSLSLKEHATKKNAQCKHITFLII